jgi:hypothetical protein
MAVSFFGRRRDGRHTDSPPLVAGPNRARRSERIPCAAQPSARAVGVPPLARSRLARNGVTPQECMNK